jgi:hypothetical protein
MAWSISLLRIEQVVAGAAASLARGPAATLPAALPDDANPRALVADALLRLRAAERMTQGSARDRLIAQAGAAITAARLPRPWYAQAWILEAYRQSLAGPQARGALAIALARSYADAPYLKESAGWRVGNAFALWSSLPASAQARAINEAVWLARMGQAEYLAVMRMARGSDAYQPFVLALLRARSGDADFTPVEGAAPQESGEE